MEKEIKKSLILPAESKDSNSGYLREEWFEPRVARMTNTSGNWSIYFKNLQTSYEYGYKDEEVVDTMSVIKIPLLLTLLKKVEEGSVSFEQEIVINTGRKRFGTGIISSLDTGHKISVKDAAVMMISLSDNSATDILYEIVGGFEEVNVCMTDLGFNQIKTLGTSFDWFRALATSIDPVAASYNPEELFVKGFGVVDRAELHRARSDFHFGDGTPFGLATPRQIGQLLNLLTDGRFISKRVSAEALQFLKFQVYGSRIPRYFPPDALVHHKTGDFNPFIANDVAVVERSDGNRFILCIFSSGNKGIWGDSEELIARFAQDCFLNLDQIA
jgi:beta-lactamase class A